MANDENALGWSPTRTWVLAAALTIVWLPLASEFSLVRFVSLVWLSLAAFMVGAVVGFLFSSYGEENSTLGKIRDWLIGGITALTVAKASSIQTALTLFAVGNDRIEVAFADGAAIYYAGLGFFFMFFQRELILNVLLARSRAERVQVEGSQEAGHVIQRLLVQLPPSLLTGVDYIDEIPDLNEAQVKELRDLLYSPDVDKFLQEATELANTGKLDWDTVSKAAYISYYRTYFERDGEAEKDRALQWITRALNMNPMHVDLTMKYAEMLGTKEEYIAAVAVLERLVTRPEAPLLVREWLGYYLRFLPNRLDDSIRHSQAYHELFPDESDSLFNMAYAYAAKYCEDIKKLGAGAPSANRNSALSVLTAALREQPQMKEIIRTKWLQQKQFACLAQDPELRALVGVVEQGKTTV